MKYILAALFLLLGIEANAQIFISEWPNGQIRHEGPMTNGLRTGLHVFNYQTGKRQAEVNYSPSGAPTHVKTWDANGNLEEDTDIERMPLGELPEEEFSREDNGLEHFIPSGGRIIHNYDGRKVTVHYAGYLADGSEFDNSFKRKKPLSFKAAMHEVIPGFDQAVSMLVEGETGWFKIPPSLGYQDHFVGNIPPESTLIYQIQLIKVK